MTDTSTYPGAVDANQHDEVLAQAQPDEFRDALALLADGLHKVQVELGITPSGAYDDVTAALVAALAGGGGGTGALAQTIYNPAILESINASGSSSQVSNGHLFATFVAPDSGAVLIQLQACASIANATAFAWGVDDGAGSTAEAQVGYVTGDGIQLAITKAIYLEGLTPGDTYTHWWTHRLTFGSGTNVTVYGGECGAAVMTVYDAAAP